VAAAVEFVVVGGGGTGPEGEGLGGASFELDADMCEFAPFIVANIFGLV